MSKDYVINYLSILQHGDVQLVKDSDGDYAVLFKERLVGYFASDEKGLADAKSCYDQTVLEQIL